MRSNRKPIVDYNRRDDMSGSYINRLKRDANELSHYISRLKKEGRYELATKVTKKQDYLEQRIAEMEDIAA